MKKILANYIPFAYLSTYLILKYIPHDGHSSEQKALILLLSPISFPMLLILEGLIFSIKILAQLF